MHSEEIKSLVRAAYCSIDVDTSAVATKLYDADQLAVVPESAISRALGVGNHLGFADIREGRSWTSAAGEGSTRSSRPSEPVPKAR
jgi:arsenite methyltransferase